MSLKYEVGDCVVIADIPESSQGETWNGSVWKVEPWVISHANKVVQITKIVYNSDDPDQYYKTEHGSFLCDEMIEYSTPYPHRENANEVLEALGEKGTIYYLKSKAYDTSLGEYVIQKNHIIGEIGGHHICPDTEYYLNGTYHYYEEDVITELREATDEESEHYIACYRAGKYVEAPEKVEEVDPPVELNVWHKNKYGNYFLPVKHANHSSGDFYECHVFQSDGSYYKSSLRCIGEGYRFLTKPDVVEMQEVFMNHALNYYGENEVRSLIKDPTGKDEYRAVLTDLSFSRRGVTKEFWMTNPESSYNILVWENGDWAGVVKKDDITPERVAEVMNGMFQELPVTTLVEALKNAPKIDPDKDFTWELRGKPKRITLDIPQSKKEEPKELLCRDLKIRPAMKRISIN